MAQRHISLSAGPPTEGGRAHDNDKKEGHKAEEFPEVHDCFMIYGGQVAYPLIVDPVIGNVRLTKVLMDGGSNLNIIYAETLGLLQIDLSTI
jgi:hypothetical protein